MHADVRPHTGAHTRTHTHIFKFETLSTGFLRTFSFDTLLNHVQERKKYGEQSTHIFEDMNLGFYNEIKSESNSILCSS